MAVDDTVQVRCTRCKAKFTDKARRVRGGYSRQCPACECMVFFEEGSPNKDIQMALREAERVRKALRHAEQEEAANRMARAREAARAASADPEETSAVPQRRIERRTFTSGRSRG